MSAVYKTFILTVLYVRETVINYLEPFIHILEIRWRALKNLPKWGVLVFQRGISALITMTFSLFHTCMKHLKFSFNCYSVVGNKMAATSQKPALEEFFTWCFIISRENENTRNLRTATYMLRSSQLTCNYHSLLKIKWQRLKPAYLRFWMRFGLLFLGKRESYCQLNYFHCSIHVWGTYRLREPIIIYLFKTQWW